MEWEAAEWEAAEWEEAMEWEGAVEGWEISMAVPQLKLSRH